MATEKETLIANLLKTMETKIKGKNNFSREDLQFSINTILKHCESLDELKQSLKDLITRTGVKKIGIRTLYTPRQNLRETDKTMDFLSDILSYNGVKEKFKIPIPEPTNRLVLN